MPMTLLTNRWRPAVAADVKEGARVMLPSGRKGTVVSIYLESPMLILVNVDGRLPTYPPDQYCQALCDLRVVRS